MCNEKKKPKYVNNINYAAQPYKKLEYFDKSCCIVLTIVPVLQALTLEGIGNDIYVDLLMLKTAKRQELSDTPDGLKK
jgi:hypothetical protein